MKEAVSKLPVMSVYYILAEHLAEALCDAAVDLSLHNSLVQHRQMWQPLGKLICGDRNWAAVVEPTATCGRFALHRFKASLARCSSGAKGREADRNNISYRLAISNRCLLRIGGVGHPSLIRISNGCQRT